MEHIEYNTSHVTDFQSSISATGSSIRKSQSKVVEATSQNLVETVAQVDELNARIEAIVKAVNILADGDKWMGEQKVISDTELDKLRGVTVFAAATEPEIITQAEVDSASHSVTVYTQANGTQVKSVTKGMLAEVPEGLSRDYLAAVDAFQDQFFDPAHQALTEAPNTSDTATQLANVLGVEPPALRVDFKSSETLKEYQKTIKESADELVARGFEYAWGGGTKDGPTQGTLAGDTSGDAAAHRDNEKIGFDCSKLTQYLANKSTGVDIGVDTYAQWKSTIPVDKGDIQVGDIAINNDKSHVIMYAGEGKFIEAPESGKNIRYGTLDEADRRGLTNWRRSEEMAAHQ